MYTYRQNNNQKYKIIIQTDGLQYVHTYNIMDDLTISWTEILGQTYTLTDLYADILCFKHFSDHNSEFPFLQTDIKTCKVRRTNKLAKNERLK